VEREAYAGPTVVVRDVPGAPPPATEQDLLAPWQSPEWLQEPSPAFPEVARLVGVAGGEVELVCTPMEGGRLSSCRTIFEDPAGVGFADALAGAMSDARLRPFPSTDANLRIRVKHRFDRP
jgi:protein TonB